MRVLECLCELTFTTNTHTSTQVVVLKPFSASSAHLKTKKKITRSRKRPLTSFQPRSYGTCPVLSGTGQANSNFIEDQDVLPNTSALPSHPLTAVYCCPIKWQKAAAKVVNWSPDSLVECHEKLLFPGGNQYGTRHTLHFFFSLSLVVA